MPGYPLPILEYCCTISNRLFGNKTRCTLHDIKPFLPAYLRTYAESALEQREIEHYRFHPLHLPTFHEIFQKCFSFFLSLSPFQFFSNLSSLTRKKQSRNRFRSVKINRCSKRAFQNTNEGGKRFETTGFERRERRTGRRFEPIVEWNLSGSLMNEIVHRSRSPPLRLVFIFSFFFSRFSLHRSLSTLAIAFPAWATGRLRFERPLDFPHRFLLLLFHSFDSFVSKGLDTRTFGNGKIEHSNQK